MRSVFLTILCVCYTWLLYSQDAKADFKTINETYHMAMNLSMDIKYELFLDGSKTADEIVTGQYIKQKNNYFTRQGGSEVIITGNYLFMIDKDSKILAVDKKIDDKKLADPLSLSLDSLFVLYTKIESINTAAPDIKGYRFFIKEGPYSMCEVLYNTKTHFVTEIKNVFRDKVTDENDKQHTAVLRTTFYNINTTATNAAVFTDSKYIVRVKQSYTLAENYKSYKFINHLK